DDGAGDQGSLAGGWSLSLTTLISGGSQPPTISDITNQTTAANTPTAAIPFTIGDAETPAASLTLSRGSSNPTLVPTNNIVFGGSGSNRTVTITPAADASGSATISIGVSDGQVTTSTNFLVTVNAVNDAPTISDIANQSTLAGTPTAAIPFTVAD